MIQVFPEQNIFKTKIKNYSETNKLLLEKISLIPNNPYKNLKDSSVISHTDFDLPKKMNREYLSIFLNLVDEHLKKLTKHFECENCQIKNYWFQQYNKGSSHGWHNHTNSHFANVYFVECPKGSSTKFKNFEVDCEEGDLLTFPAFLPHSSPIIENDTRKTVIAFNIDLILGD